MKVFEKSQNSLKKIIFVAGFTLFAYLAYSFIYKPLSSQKLSSKNNKLEFKNNEWKEDAALLEKQIIVLY